MIKPYYEASGITLYEGDSAEVLNCLEASSVQCCVTSPPYDNLRTYKGFAFDFETIARNLCNVMCEGGIIAWNVGDSVVNGSETLTASRQAIYFMDVCKMRVHDTMIYEKTNNSNPDGARYDQTFEYVFVISKGRPRVFNPIRDRKNIWAGTGPFGAKSTRDAKGNMIPCKRTITAEYGKRTNVWRCKTASQENVCQPIEHPAVMPYGLCRDHMLSWSNEGDLVIDPFCGSGTTAEACLKTGRNFIGIDIERSYLDMTIKRIEPILAQGKLEL